MGFKSVSPFGRVSRPTSNADSNGVGAIHVPTVPNRDKNGGVIYFDIFSRLLNERIIMLYGTVEDNMAAVIVSQLLYLEAQDHTKPIYMYINSGGGEMHAGFSIIDTMQYIRCPVYTICVGFAASMASLILVAGERGNRYALPNAWIMIHQPNTGMSGKASDLAIQTRQILRMRDQANKFYQQQLAKPHTLEQIAILVENDNYLDPTESLGIGIIDEIISSAKQVPGAPQPPSDPSPSSPPDTFPTPAPAPAPAPTTPSPPQTPTPRDNYTMKATASTSISGDSGSGLSSTDFWNKLYTA
ncbi:Clp protease-domain-containing protein [Lipomyces arxii]|uniref:Clp protease-domain-containing protein n=1 Tax=Lipomyces arxii TaxID=56418 RepID=UPI0034CFD1BE